MSDPAKDDPYPTAAVAADRIYARVMIQSGRASLTVVSTETDPALISEILGIVPTRVKRRGSLRRSGRPLEHNVWTIEVERSSNTDADETGTRPLSDLVASVRPAIGKLSLLPTDCEARIWWSADSDSTQGGFVIPAALAANIAALAVDVHATVYLEEDSNSAE
jgi:hypothetical protein